MVPNGSELFALSPTANLARRTRMTTSHLINRVISRLLEEAVGMDLTDGQWAVVEPLNW